MPSTRPEKPRNEREVRLAATSVMGKPCKNFGISAVSSFSPVSYTHLDVYKRQYKVFLFSSDIVLPDGFWKLGMV